MRVVDQGPGARRIEVEAGTTQRARIEEITETAIDLRTTLLGNKMR